MSDPCKLTREALGGSPPSVVEIYVLTVRFNLE
jgi:hypothetical protein